ncbi:MAG TPA: nickel transporter permease [Nitrolancea sp.]|jgi:peptide/nickel transport system permease protein|nr:nickel transporter permease [Nitrolancea sp.]
MNIRASTSDTQNDAAALQGYVRMADSRRRRLEKSLRVLFVGKWLNVFGALLIVLFLILCAFGPVLAPYDPLQPNVEIALQGPSASHLFGTDQIGRDLLSRVMAGARISLGVAAIVLSIAVVLGVVVGGTAGYFGGIVDATLMRVTDVFLAFPALILAMAIAATLGPSLTNTMIALGAVYWPWYARLIRGQVFAVRNWDYVTAAHAVGASHVRIIGRHILPNSISPVIVQLTIDCGFAILSTASLSFIGLGAQPPSPEWGAMINSAQTYFQQAWWFIAFPSVALTLTVIGFNLAGDGLRDYLDPRTRTT